MPTSKSAAIHAKLDHPVIDSDGHMIEFEPGFLDYLKREGGASMVKRFLSPERNSGGWGRLFRWYGLSPEERLDQRATRSPWWPLPTKNTLDRATAMLPKLLSERMDSIGLDFHRSLSDAGPTVPAYRKHRNTPGKLPGAEYLSCRVFSRVCQPDDPGGRHSHAHAAGGH